MKTELKSWKDFHHRINLVYHAVIAFSLVPFALVFLDIDSGARRLESPIEERFHLPLIIVLLAVAGMVCLIVWRKAARELAQIDQGLGIKPRIVRYIKIQTERYLMLEFSAIVSLVGLWLTTNYIFVVAYLLVLVQFSLLRPSQDKLIRDLQFTKEEREKLRESEL